jgi:hypothetical protein
MVQGNEVLRMLLPEGGWIISGDDFEGIQFIDCEPITKKQFTDGFAQFDAWKAKQDEAKEAQRQAILNRLGLTAEEAQLLLGGN